MSGGNPRKRASLILFAIAAALTLGSCDWFGSDLSPEEINAALAVAATQMGWMELVPPNSVYAGQSAVAVPRPPIPFVDGSEGGTATFFITSGEPLSGTVTFADFTFTLGTNDEYVLDGSLVLALDFPDYPNLTATFSGTLSIEKNGSAAREYEIDLTQVIEVERVWGDDSISVTLTVTTTGTINGESAAGELGFSYTWPVEMPL